jgi:hypothetical protein
VTAFLHHGPADQSHADLRKDKAIGIANAFQYRHLIVEVARVRHPHTLPG